jgi:hypothetical protein
MSNSAHQTAQGFITETAPVTLTASKANDIRIDTKPTAMYCNSAGNIVYIPHGKDPNFSNIKSINGITAGTFTNILADFVLGAYSGSRGLDQFQEIVDNQSAGVLTASGTSHVEFVAGTYTLDLVIDDNDGDDPNDGDRGTYSFVVVVNDSNTITSIKIQEMALGLEAGDDIKVPADTFSSSHDAFIFNLPSGEIPSSTVVPNAGTTASIQAYR